MNDNRPLTITLLFCENCLNQPSIDDYSREKKEFVLKSISLPCSGKVDIQYLIKAIETGADGVLLVTCKFGECRHLQGNLRAHKRVAAIGSLLEETGLNREMIQVVNVKNEDETEFISKRIEDFKNRVTELKNQKSEVAKEA